MPFMLAVRVVALMALLSATVPTLAQAPGRRTARQSPSFDVVEKSIEELQRALAAGEVTSRDLVDLYLARIDAYDQHRPSLNALVALNPRAREAADALDAERRSGRVRGPLHGIPVLVKDNYETIEMPTSAGSIALAGFHPKRDAYLVQRLKDAGAIILGKTNMHELAAGITTVGSRFGYTRNPYDLDRNPGGSSGGTGAAVAANFAAAGMGSDTCGSIRNPASHNNLVGLRGTQGPVEPHRHRAALEHPGYRRAARTVRVRPHDHARRDGRRRRRGSSEPRGCRQDPVVVPGGAAG